MTESPVPIGFSHGVSVEVAVRDAVTAEVDLSCACMFSHEVGEGPTGGLAHLDATLGHAATLLRREGHFAAAEGETLLIPRPPSGIAARQVLLIGLGAPEVWTPQVMARAVATAVGFAGALKASSVAFAPGMLDGGLPGSATSGAPEAMVAGLVQALDLQARLHALDFSDAPVLKRWVFDVGGPRFAGAIARFGAALHSLPPTQAR